MIEKNYILYNNQILRVVKFLNSLIGGQIFYNFYTGIDKNYNYLNHVKRKINRVEFNKI